jgi:hypothetical protein
MRCAVLSSRPELAPGNVSGVFEFVVGVVGNYRRVYVDE